MNSQRSRPRSNFVTRVAIYIYIYIYIYLNLNIFIYPSIHICKYLQNDIQNPTKISRYPIIRRIHRDIPGREICPYSFIIQKASYQKIVSGSIRTRRRCEISNFPLRWELKQNHIFECVYSITEKNKQEMVYVRRIQNSSRSKYSTYSFDNNFWSVYETRHMDDNRNPSLSDCV